MKNWVRFLVFLMALSAPAPVLAGQHQVALGVNYPGLSFKYFPKSNLSLEPKVQFGNEVFAAGLRCNYYFSRAIYSGAELSFVTFEGELSEGAGMAVTLYGGLEIFTTDSISLQLDIGPTLLFLSDKNWDVSGSYFDILGNIGINYYFGGRK